MRSHWDKLFREQGKVFLKVQEDIPRIEKLFKKKRVKKVLDLGCGSGRHLVYLAKKDLMFIEKDIYFNLTKDLIKKEFKNFKIPKIWLLAKI